MESASAEMKVKGNGENDISPEEKRELFHAIKKLDRTVQKSVKELSGGGDQKKTFQRKGTVVLAPVTSSVNPGNSEVIRAEQVRKCRN